jgi:hypothetical protein
VLASVLAVRDLTTACKTLLFWQAEKEKGIATATGQVTKWVEIVTSATAKAKVAVAKLSIDAFIQHCLELVEYKIDTSCIQSVQLVASKPSFMAYNKLKEQLAMYENCNNYALSQAGKVADLVIESRNVIKRASVVEQALRTHSDNEKRLETGATEKELSFTKLPVSYGKVTKEPIVNGLLKIARKAQPAIDLETEHRFKGIMARQARQDNKNKLWQADKALRQALELAEKEKVK